ncbi:class II fructose-bisphosphate aldolase [soil metagenome]
MPNIYLTLEELEEKANPVIGSLSFPQINDVAQLRESFIDDLIFTAEFSEDDVVKKVAGDTIYKLASLTGANSTSIYPLYSSFGRQEIDGFTVPALNVRTLSYDFARLIFRMMLDHEIGAIVFELSRTEITYTHQNPREYILAILAAAIREGYQGPIFILGDHYQFNKEKFDSNKEKEIEDLKVLIKESLDAGYGNIDIDASTLVDLGQKELVDQQKDNSEMTALLITYIRSLETHHHTISIGGEIGHIGDRNSTVEDFEAFITQYQKLISGIGISKVSVQTGTSHGGTPLPDGTLKAVTLDFSVLNSISTVARDNYQIGGAVQHGASTLPLEDFNHFVENKTLEIHLATGLQNIIYDNLPTDLKDEMYTWIKETLQDERKPDWTEEQFIYKARKKALGPFKELLWTLSEEEKQPILQELENHLTIILKELRTFGTRQKVLQLFR